MKAKELGGGGFRIGFAAHFDVNNIQEDAQEMSTYSSDGTPCVYISGESERLGIIT